MSCEWPPCLASADVQPGEEDFLRSSYSKFLDIHVCLIYHARLSQNWGRGLPRDGKEGVCNKAALTDFGLVWMFMDIIFWMDYLEGFWIGFVQFGLDFICESLKGSA